MSDIIVEVNGTNDGLTLIKGESRIQLTLDELNEVRKKINFMDYREDVYMVLTERDHLECYFNEKEYDIDRIIADVKSGENDDALTDIMSYYGDLREEHSTGDPDEMLDWQACMRIAIVRCIDDGDFAQYKRDGAARESDGGSDYWEQARKACESRSGTAFYRDDDASDLNTDIGLGL